MKTYILVGAVALFAIALAVMPAAAAADKVTAMGTVIDERGQPVPGANVTLIDDNYREIGTTTTDVIGNFKFVNVELAGSPYLKVRLSYGYSGKIYNNSLSDMQWYDGSSGILTFDRNFTKLNDYPVSDHGYIWGPIMSSVTNGRTMNGTVYLVNGTRTLTAETGLDAAYYMYEIEATPGDYEIYAVHREGDVWLVSNRTKVTITPSYSVRTSAPQMLVADVVTTSPPPAPVPAGDQITAQGTVTDLQGNPVAGASVTLIDDNFRTLGTTMTDASGNFRFTAATTGGSNLVKAEVSYVHDGQTYQTSLENVRWNDLSNGLLSFNPMDTRLYNYPPGNHGYVWGVVLDGLANGRVMDSTVYLKNNTGTLSTETSASGMGSFDFEVAPGDYEIYAVHGSGEDRLVSNRTTIHVYQTNDLLLSAPINLIVDQKDSSKPVAALPLAGALALGLVIIIAGWAFLGRKK